MAGAATEEQDKTLPLPRWLERVYFIFPIVLYVPDVIFNYFVYSDGGTIPKANLVLQVAQITLWAFMAVGVVGMAYLLSVLAPWHWGRGHRMQAIFCGLGVVVATAITTWNSLAFRSSHFTTFPTDKWVDSVFPSLQGISLTMVLVAIAPPFWGLFWAVVQPTQGNRSLRHLQESHEERMLRLQQDAEIKQLRAEANAQVRAAQLKGMAQTAAAARDQAAQLLRRGNTSEVPALKAGDPSDSGAHEQPQTTITEVAPEDSNPALPAPANVLQLPNVKPLPAGRGGPVFMNRAAAAPAPTVRSAPGGVSPAAMQPQLMGDVDASPAAGGAGDPMPWGGPRRPIVPGGGIMGTFFPEDEATGTTGPRPAVRRPGDNSTLFRSMSEGLSPQGEQLIDTVLRELNPNGSKKSVSRKDMMSRLTSKLNGDETTAQKLIDQWAKARKTAKGNGQGS